MVAFNGWQARGLESLKVDLPGNLQAVYAQFLLNEPANSQKSPSPLMGEGRGEGE
jgi:hypothetical protein